MYSLVVVVVVVIPPSNIVNPLPFYPSLHPSIHPSYLYDRIYNGSSGIANSLSRRRVSALGNCGVCNLSGDLMQRHHATQQQQLHQNYYFYNKQGPHKEAH